MNTRSWSIRTKITALVVVPIAALLALWIFATVLAIGPALNLLSGRTLLDNVRKPGDALVAELQGERRLSAIFLAGTGDARALRTQRESTDRALAAFRARAGGDRAHRAASATLRGRIQQVFTALDGLAAGRGYIDRREVDSVGAQNLYSSFIDGIFRMFSATARFEQPQIDQEIRAVATIGQGREWLSRADSLLAGAYTAGKFTSDESSRLIQDLGTQQYLYGMAVPDLPESQRAAYQRLTASESYLRLQQMQNVLVQSSIAGNAPPVPAEAWHPVYESVAQQLRAFELNATEALANRASPVAFGILARLAAAGLLGLAAVVVSMLVSVRVARSLIGRLIRLRATLDTAGEQLPKLVSRLRHGESVDVDAESPPINYGGDEIGQLAEAFTKVRRVAVQSAVDEAGVRQGLNEVFLNIARRSQTLLHRQLSLLDRMERRETEPQDLEDLYRVDHLATRMRRHAEDLVILAGAVPGRGWRNPVPVIDVVRGAISEVEEYKRIDVSGVETSSLVGRAVGDVIHLIAELVENAASFSPPNTRVQVAGQVVANGYAVEVQDRGLGMSPEALAEANRRLLEPPEFDPADSARLGLFVVAKLAGRHRIKVQLRTSAYGGVTAVALIPADLITPGTEQKALPVGPSGADRSWDRPPTPVGSESLRPAVPVESAMSAGPLPAGPNSAGPNSAGRVSAGSASSVVPRQVRRAPRPAVPGGGSAPTEPAAAPLPPTALLPPEPRVLPDTRMPTEIVVPGESRTLPEPRGLTEIRTPADLRVGPTSDGLTGDGPTNGGLTVDGLAQRRRIGPRHRSTTVDPAGLTPPSWNVTSLPNTPSVDDAPPPTPAPAIDVGSLAPDSATGRPGPGSLVDPVLGEDGLPRRIRQANLTPQLRRRASPQAEATTRSPEEVRRMMSALQMGTTRGRLAAADRAAPPGGPPPPPAVGYVEPPAGGYAEPPPGGHVDQSVGGNVDRQSGGHVEPQFGAGAAHWDAGPDRTDRRVVGTEATPGHPSATAGAPTEQGMAEQHAEVPWSLETHWGARTNWGARTDGGGRTDGGTRIEWADVATAGYPLTRDAAGAAAAAETVVHYGEIVPRRADRAGDNPASWHAKLSTASRDGEENPPEKDA